MGIEDLKNGRYLLFLDILGFKEITQNKSPKEIYSFLNTALKTFEHWERTDGQFKVIYFSDTFLFFQEPKGYGDWAFLDIHALSSFIISALLAEGIPARGAITFGEFEVEQSSSNRQQLFYGKALVEAYEAEQKEMWIGITIQPSAWEPYEQFNVGSIKILENEKIWKCRNDGVLLLNPFRKIAGWYAYSLVGEVEEPYSEWDKPEFPNELSAFRFLVYEFQKLSAEGQYSTKTAIKYHTTLNFIMDILGEDVFSWAFEISKTV